MRTESRYSPLAVRGSLWLVSASLATRGAGVLAQILVAWFLSEHDFGVYAVAISAATLAVALREGGVRQVLVRMRSRLNRVQGPAFWVALVTNSLLCVTLWSISAPVAAFFSEPDIAGVMKWIALSFPLGTPAAIATAQLSLRLDFRALSTIQAASALVRYGGLLALAAAGFGAHSFAIPLPIVAVTESVLACWLSRTPLWWRPGSLRLALLVFRRARWLLLGSAGLVAMNYGTGVGVRLFLPTAAVGTFFFGSQLLMQASGLLSGNVASVLFPILTPLASDFARLQAAALRAYRQITLVLAAICGFVTVVFPFADAFLWSNKWAEATGVIVAFGTFQPLAGILGVSMPLEQSCGSLRRWGVAAVGLGAISLVASSMGAFAFREPVGTAWCVSAASAVAITVHATMVARHLTLSPVAVLQAVAPVWLVSTAITVSCREIVARTLLFHSPLVNGVLTGCAYACFTLVAFRLLFAGSLRDLLQALPAPVQGPLRVLLRLPSE